MKFKKLLAMALAIAMIASLAPLAGTTARADDTGTLKITVAGDRPSDGNIVLKITQGKDGQEKAIFTQEVSNYVTAENVTASIDTDKKTLTVTLQSGVTEVEIKNLPLSAGSDDKYKVRQYTPEHELNNSLTGDQYTVIHGKTTGSSVSERKLNDISSDIELTSGKPAALVRFDTVKAGGTLTILTIKNDVIKDGAKDSVTELKYTVTGESDISTYRERNAGEVVAEDNKSFTVKVKSGNSHSLVLPAGTYMVTQVDTGYKTSLSGDGDFSGLTATVITTADKRSAVTYNNISASADGVRYHLNIPDGLYDSGKDYIHFAENKTVLELAEAANSSGTGFVCGGDKIDSAAKDPYRDHYETIEQGYIGGSINSAYFFVGWSEEDPKTNQDITYSDVTYPVGDISSGKKDSPIKGYRNLYSSAGISKYTTTAADLYAIWAPVETAGLFGYAMQVSGASFPGVANLKSGQDTWFTKTSDGKRLGDSGTGGSGTWQKFAVLDGGHTNSTSSTSDTALTVDMPNPTVTVGSDTWNFTGWFDKAAADKDDPNSDYLFAPTELTAAGDNKVTVTGAAGTVKYGGDKNLYSLDAVWSRITSPASKTVLYKAGGNTPSFAGLGVALKGGKYSGSQITAWEKIFGVGSYAEGDRTVANSVLKYYVEISGPEVPAGYESSSVKTLAELATLKLTKPGKYTITVNPKLENVSTSNGKDGGKTDVDIDFGTITFTYTIIPQLTVEVTKEITGDNPWTLDHGNFEFDVTVTKDGVAGNTTVTGSPITVNKDKKTGSAVISFGKGDDIAETGTYTITIKERKGSALGMTYNETEQTIRVELNKENGTLTGGNIVEDTASPGNYKTTNAVTMTNTYSTGSLTVTKTVVANGSTKGEGKAFTITVTFDNWTPPESLTSIDGIDSVAGHVITLKLADKGSATIQEIPVGATYTVRETDSQGATVSYSATSGTITAGDTNSVTVTNTYKPLGTLTLSKAITGRNVPAGTKRFTFEITTEIEPFDITTIRGATFDATTKKASVTVTAGTPLTITGLPIGNYTVTEKFPDNTYYAFESVSGATASANPATVTITEDGTANVTFTNKYTQPAGSLTVTKEIEGGATGEEKFNFTVTFSGVPDDGFELTGIGTGPTVITGTDNTAAFTITTDGTGKGSQKLEGIPVGVSYTVTEAAAAGYVSASATASGTISAKGEEKTAAFTNYKIGEALTVTKTVTAQDEHVTAPADATFQIDVSFILPSDVSSCVVSYNGTTKTISSGNSTVSVTLANGGSCVFSGLPVGTHYSVEEQLTPEQQQNYTSVITGGTGEIEATETEAAVANTYYELKDGTGALWIRKVVQGTGTGADTEFTFTVTFEQGDADATAYADFIAGSETRTVTLKNNQTVPILGIPVGTKYTVTESAAVSGAGGYTPAHVVMTVVPTDGRERDFTSNDDTRTVTGRIDGSRDVDGVTVYNQYLKDLTLELVVDNTVPQGAEFTFELRFSGLTADQVSSLMKIKDANGMRGVDKLLPDFQADDTVVITLKNAKDAEGTSLLVATIYNVPLGVSQYTITEVGANAGTVRHTVGAAKDENIATGGTVGTSTGNQIFADGTSYVTMKNTYAGSGWLTVEKKVEGDGTPSTPVEYTFEITRKEDGSFVRRVSVTGANSVMTALPADEYVVTEITKGDDFTTKYQVGTGAASAEPAQVEVTVGGKAAVTVVNTYTNEPEPGPGVTPPPTVSGGGSGSGGDKGDIIDRTEHYGYIIGVTADEVRPEQTITRAEVATILFRLLTDEAREANWSEDSGFPDVKSGAWYNHAVAVLHNLGIVKGDDYGNFNPDDRITRAEVAAMVVRFYEKTEGTVLNNRFTDVDETKWYAQEVLLADHFGLMQGDGDRFKPEDLLTRAEAMTVFNRLLGRKPHRDHLHEGMIAWVDNADKTKWYYADVQEATNSHECGEDVVIDGTTFETWAAITPMRDWAALEY